MIKLKDNEKNKKQNTMQRIINNAMEDAVSIMEMKINELKLIHDMFKDEGDKERCRPLKKQISELKKAIGIINNNCFG